MSSSADAAVLVSAAAADSADEMELVQVDSVVVLDGLAPTYEDEAADSPAPVDDVMAGTNDKVSILNAPDAPPQADDNPMASPTPPPSGQANSSQLRARSPRNAGNQAGVSWGPHAV